MSLLDSVKVLEGLLTCQICHKLLDKTHTVGECGHNFCYQCVSEKLGKDAMCPACHLPAVIKNLHKTLMYDNLLALTLKLKQVVSKEPCFQNNPDITVTTLTCLETDQQVKQDDTNDTTDKEFDIFDLSPLSQISEEETEAHDMTSENNNKREESAKKTASSDDEDLNHAKRRKLSAVMGQGSDGNGFKSNGFSDMDDDKEHSHRDDDEQTSDSDTWHCKWCAFEHEAYISTCSICHKYRGSEYIPRLSQSNDTNTSQEVHKQSSNQKGSLKRKLEPELEEVHILTTGLTDKEEVGLKRNLTTAAKNGMRIVVHHDLKKFDQVTHIITSMDKDGLCKRTLKYLSSVICGKWVVDQNWLTHSVKREQWLREQPYEVKGDQAAGKTHAPSTGRRLREEKRPLFGEKHFFFSGDFPPKYNKKDLAQLCQTAGGTLLKRKPTLADKNLQNIYIIHPESTKSAQHWLDDFQVKDPSWVIDSVSKLSTT